MYIQKIMQTQLIIRNDDYLDAIIMSACRDKKIATRLEKLAGLALKKYSNTPKFDNKLIF